MDTSIEAQAAPVGRMKFAVGGLLILAAVIYLIVSSTSANAQYFVTVDELVSNSSQMSVRDVRVSGAVIGDTIQYDPDSLTLTFSVADMPGDMDKIEELGGLAKVLHDAVSDPNRSKLTVVYVGPKPDLLQNEAQAIMTGKLGEDGVFHADELLLKCPTRYEEYDYPQAEG